METVQTPLFTACTGLGEASWCGLWLWLWWLDVKNYSTWINYRWIMIWITYMLHLRYEHTIIVLSDAIILVPCRAYNPIYKNVLFQGINDLEWSKQDRQWISHPKINMKSGITLAYSAQTQKVRIFIMTGGGHIWFGNYVISGGVTGKHLGDFSCPGTHWQKSNEKLPQHHFVNGFICQVQD